MPSENVLHTIQLNKPTGKRQGQVLSAESLHGPKIRKQVSFSHPHCDPQVVDDGHQKKTGNLESGEIRHFYDSWYRLRSDPNMLSLVSVFFVEFSEPPLQTSPHKAIHFSSSEEFIDRLENLLS